MHYSNWEKKFLDSLLLIFFIVFVQLFCAAQIPLQKDKSADIAKVKKQIVSSQVFLQLEKIGSTDRIKLEVGDLLQFKTIEYKDTWRSEYIERIMPEEHKLIIAGQFFDLDDFYKIRFPRRGFERSVGPIMQSFGAGWFFFGGMAALFLNYDFSTADLVIGAVGVIMGTLYRKLLKYRTFRIGKNARLRYVDLRMVLPENYDASKVKN